jgi:hypothetical protein
MMCPETQLSPSLGCHPFSVDKQPNGFNWEHTAMCAINQPINGNSLLGYVVADAVVLAFLLSFTKDMESS